jgi:hypothetical protein
LLNVYEAVPNADGTAAADITNTLVTPFGNVDLPTDYDAIANLNPTESFAGLDNPSKDLLFDDSGGDGGAGSIPGSDNAFTLGGLTYDPGSDGWSNGASFGGGGTGEPGFTPLVGNAPLLELTPGTLPFPGGGGIPIATQDFDLYAGENEIGTATTSVNAGNLLGIETTQFTVTGVTPADAADPSDALPAEGTTYSVIDFGGGFENVYQAVPNEDGTAAASITNTLVTPWGNLDLPTDYDAIAPLDPGDPFEALGVDGGAGSDNAFTVGGFTFDPGSDGWSDIEPLYGVAPLMEIGGGTIDLRAVIGAGQPTPLATQDLEVYNNAGDQVGTVDTDVMTSNILGIETTQFTIDDIDAAAGGSDALPEVGTVYSVTDLGGGFANVYIAVPGDDGAASITDTFVTPWGNVDVVTDFDATAPLDPGDAAAGVTDAGGGLFGDLF